eukprot:CAMPEP_0172676484 /NCGR_PEP_ID=MMETSP1074-20121228/14015_1 /TAXON_ID=2916 /ORGANISM="Ceratium fusus, Strain PA161109" /LENGTH=209 /DNA_ID=CAMNT_0013494159 /DNA_START=21 /DNA_END=650 /DNA_ORIENTATION=-
MATMQQLLLQKGLNKELPERVAEDDVLNATKKLEEDQEDVLALEEWHTSEIQSRVSKLEFPAHCRQGQVDFCQTDAQEGLEQRVAKIVYHKPALARSWYMGRHGLDNVRFDHNIVYKERTSNRGRRVTYQARGNQLQMHFSFASAEGEAKLREQCLAGRRSFELNNQLALALLKPRLPEKVTEIVKMFIPDYVEHLKQEKELIQKTLLW